jgi:Tfp pilus assembly protein PilZ
MSDTQQRKDRRFKQWNKTTIQALGEHKHSTGHAVAEGFTYDLSLGGARIHSAESFEVGAPLKLSIELIRTKETLNVEGRVKWLRHNEAENVYEMGVEFSHANSQTVMSLMKNLHDNGVANRR